MYYLRTENGCIEFLVDDIHDIKETDIPLTNEEYEEFFNRQTNGESFRLCEVVTLTGNGLFSYVESFIPDQVPIEQTDTEIDLLRKEVAELKELISELQNPTT